MVLWGWGWASCSVVAKVMSTGVCLGKATLRPALLLCQSSAYVLSVYFICDWSWSWGCLSLILKWNFCLLSRTRAGVPLRQLEDHKRVRSRGSWEWRPQLTPSGITLWRTHSFVVVVIVTALIGSEPVPAFCINEANWWFYAIICTSHTASSQSQITTQSLVHILFFCWVRFSLCVALKNPFLWVTGDHYGLMYSKQKYVVKTVHNYIPGYKAVKDLLFPSPLFAHVRICANTHTHTYIVTEVLPSVQLRLFLGFVTYLSIFFLES